MTSTLPAALAIHRRELRYVPLTGPQAPITAPQGRQGGEAFSPAGLDELKSSIAASGLLQPVLCETLEDGALRIVHGERRYRAFRQLAADDPNHWAVRGGLPTLVVPAPLTEADRRVWQLAENLERSDPSPRELGLALLYARNALFIEAISEAHVEMSPPSDTEPDPLVTFEYLNTIGKAHGIQPPTWQDTLDRCGIALSLASAKKIIRAIRRVPLDLAESLDAAAVSGKALLQFSRAFDRSPLAARSLWEQLMETNKTHLLSGAAGGLLAGLDPAEAVAEAERRAQQANHARSVALTQTQGPGGEEKTEPADETEIGWFIAACRQLLNELATPKRISPYEIGSAQLLLTNINNTFREMEKTT